jgi:cytochrome c oxidase subunit 4
MAVRNKVKAGMGAPGASANRPNYVLVFLTLGFLTLLEVLVATMGHVPKVPFLLGMSFIKAMLVILYFMHLRYDSRWFGLIFFLPFLLVIPLLAVVPH